MRASCNRLSLGVSYVASYVVTRCANPTRGYVMTPRGTQLIDKLSLGLNLMLFDSDPNVIKLSSNTLLYQGVTGCSTRFRKQWVRFGPTFDRAGLDAVRAVGIDHQRG